MSELTCPAPWRPPHPLPTSFETERLVLRFWEDSDAPALFRIIDQSRADMIPWLPWAPIDHLNLTQTIFCIEKFRRERAGDSPLRDNFVIAIVDRATGEPLGGTGLHRINHAAHEAEIGYWIRSDRTRQGICTEATRGLISWAFMPQATAGAEGGRTEGGGGWGLRRVHIRCAAANLASKAVPTKIGLRQEVRIKDERWVNTIGWVDTLGWGVLASEWDTRRHALK